MKKNRLVKLLILSVILGSSCKNDPLDDCFKSTGKIETEDRTVAGSFNTINVNDNVNLVYTDDSITPGISVQAGNNLLSEITTEVQNNQLILHNNNKCNWVRKFGIPINIYVHAHPIIKIIQNGSGNVSSTNTITEDQFNFESWGAGNCNIAVNLQNLYCSLNLDAGSATITGNANAAFLYSAGNGFFYNDSLTTSFTSLIAKSTGDSYVSVQNLFWVYVEQEGNVYYKGNPTIVDTITGKGKLINNN
jgi:putative autotransporter adhesin-like protein